MSGGKPRPPSSRPCSKHGWIGPGDCPDCARDSMDLAGEPMGGPVHPALHSHRFPPAPWEKLEAERERTRLDVFNKAWDATKDERLRVELAIAFLTGLGPRARVPYLP